MGAAVDLVSNAGTGNEGVRMVNMQGDSPLYLTVQRAFPA